MFRFRLGFSLMELSIVVTILSVIAAMGLEISANYVNRNAYTLTDTTLANADTALRQFFQIYGRLPCPANRTLGPMDPSKNYGFEDCSAALAIPGTLRNLGGPPFGTPGGGVLAGALPFRTLNLPMSASLDGFGDKINYFVTYNFTQAGSGVFQFGFVPPPPGVPMTAGQAQLAGIGGIEIHTGQLTLTGNTCGTGGSFCSVVAAVTTDFTTNTGAAYAVFSNGADQRGAYSRNGTLVRPCVASTNFNNYVDSQNCISTYDNTNPATGNPLDPTLTVAPNVLYDKPSINNGYNATKNYFDDRIIWRTRSQL